MKVPARLCLSAVAACVLVTPAAAQSSSPVSLENRVRGSERVVVASVAQVSATYETNDSGDRLIVSHVALRVEEALKGPAADSLAMHLPGGTVGDMTLEVSDLPSVRLGERGVFFLSQDGHGRYVPHLDGLGILKLDSQNRVKGTSLDLNTIRALAASVSGR